MKKTIVLTVILCLATRVFAANPTDDPHLFCDFENPSISPALRFHAPSGGGTVNIAANPSKTGLNTSNTVLKVISPVGANWGGCIFTEESLGEKDMYDLYGVNAVTGYDYVDVLMYRESNSNTPQLKVVDQDDYGTNLLDLDLNPIEVNGVAGGAITQGVWQKVTYSITRCHNTGIHFIYIMPDRLEQSTVYIDDIVFRKDNEKPVMGTASCGISTDGSISLDVNATDNLSNPVGVYLITTDGNKTHATEYVASGGVITVTGLDANKEYTFTIWAKDYAGNVSDNYTTCTCSTTEPAAGNWCHKSLTVSGHTIDVSCEKKDGKYVLTIESNEVMSGLGGTFWFVNGISTDVRTNCTITDGGKKITCTAESLSEITFDTPLYVLMPAEVTFPKLTDITWGKCASSEPCTPPSGGYITYPNLSYNYGATPWDIEFDYPCTGTNLHYQWYTNTTGVPDASDVPYTGPGNNTPACTPSTTEPIGSRTYYYCKIWNECGTIYSTIANVDIVSCTWDGSMSISAPSSVVEGNTLTLTMNYSGYGGIKTICWYHNNVQIWCDPVDTLFNQSVLIISPCTLEDAGSYYCVMQDGTSCTMTSPTKTVNVTPGTTPEPTVINHPEIEICLGTSVTLTGGATGPWKWTPNGEITKEITVEGTAVGTTAYSCTTASQIDNYTVKVKDCMVIINHDPQTVCLGETIVLEGGPTGPWNWSTTETTQQITIVCSTLGTFNYTCTTSLQTDNYTITVEDCTPPPPTEITHPAEDVCLDSVKVLTGAALGPWLWNTGETTRTITVKLTAVGTYNYTCTTATQIDYFTLNAIDCTPPVEPCEDLIYRKWNDVLFVNNRDSLFITYQWYKDGLALEGETRQYYYTEGQSMENDGHEYHAVAFKADGSSVKACAYTFDNFTRSADENPGEKKEIQIYPNPVKRNMPIHVIGVEENAVLILFNTLGQKMAQYVGLDFIPDVPVGCYILYTTDADNRPCCKTLIVE